jgi:cell division protein FtsQ
MKNRLPAPWDVKVMNMTASALFLAFALGGAGALAGWVSNLPLFAIGGISVSGEVTHNNAVTLRANVAPQLAGTIFTLDLAAARSAFEAVPWVRQATVRREFPNRLKVQLQEHQAAAYWGDEGESRMVNSFGEVFEANVGEVDAEMLPRLSGPEGQAAQVLTMYQSLEPLFEEMDLTLEQVEMTSHGGWRVRLEEGAAIELGNGTVDEVQRRTLRFLKTLTQVASRYGRKPDALEAADLRHEDGYAIRLRGVTTLAADGQKK